MCEENKDAGQGMTKCNVVQEGLTPVEQLDEPDAKFGKEAEEAFAGEGKE